MFLDHAYWCLHQIHEVIFTNPEGEARGVGEYYRVCLDEDTSRHDLTVLYPTDIATYLQPLQHTRVPLPVNPRLFQQLSLDL